MQNAMATVLTVLGLVVAVGGPVIAALAANPVVAAHSRLVGILAGVGVIITVAGVAHDALLKWQASSHVQALEVLRLQQEKKTP